MLDLHSAFEDFVPDIELAESSIDTDFITSFLLPYFQDLPREQLEATLAQIIMAEQDRSAAAFRPR